MRSTRNSTRMMQETKSAADGQASDIPVPKPLLVLADDHQSPSVHAEHDGKSKHDYVKNVFEYPPYLLRQARIDEIDADVSPAFHGKRKTDEVSQTSITRA